MDRLQLNPSTIITNEIANFELTENFKKLSRKRIYLLFNFLNDVTMLF